MAPKRKTSEKDSPQPPKKAKVASKPKPRAKTRVAPKPKAAIKARARTPAKARPKVASKPKARTPATAKAASKPKAKTPVTASKPRPKTPVSSRPKTPASSGSNETQPRSRNSSPAPKKTTPGNSNPATPTSSFKIIKPRPWEEKAAQLMRKQLHLIDNEKTKTPDHHSSDGYLKAYWNLPQLKHRDELPCCYYRACIFDGYRDQWTWHEATVSLFSMHNETMCIWSHLLPLLCSLVAAVWLGFHMQENGSTAVEQLMMAIFVFTACTCLLLSSVYHWYGCMSEGHFYCLLSMDLGGIACLIAGSFFPGVYYGFYCTPGLQKIYIGVTCMILLIGLVVSFFGATKSPNAALIRQGGFAALTVFGFVPLCHWMLIAPSAYKDKMTLGALGMFFFYGLGFSCLLTSFPESVWRNNYITTYLVPSHALWHLGVAAAIFTWFYSLLQQHVLLKDLTCEPFESYIKEFEMESYAF